MTENQKPNRRTTRLPHYDYSQPGAYFVTICTHERTLLFGEVIDSEVQLTEMGEIVFRCWQEIPQHFPNTETDALIIMPNHIHGIIWIIDPTRRDMACHVPTTDGHIPTADGHAPTAQFGKPVPGSLSTIIGSYKSAVSKHIHRLPDNTISKVWQKRFYDRVIRDENELNRTRQYIQNNPLQWELDRENPANV